MVLVIVLLLFLSMFCDLFVDKYFFLLFYFGLFYYVGPVCMESDRPVGKMFLKTSKIMNPPSHIYNTKE